MENSKLIIELIATLRQHINETSASIKMMISNYLRNSKRKSTNGHV